LDEVPQLLNVVHGEMSLVGPRPHALGTSVRGVLLPDLISSYDSRHRVRPGRTGLAQVSGLRGELDTEEKAYRRIQCDLEYIANWSLWLDCRLLAATVRCVLGGGCAY
jgi:lipopolysaccharide/colanic/teichoic acid biosynthesis glycosyltransferase